MLTLTASGSVSDYSDTTALRRSIAASAGVAPSSTVITVAAASVIITATITVPASTAASVQTKLSSSLGTAAAASAALGITVESDPTVTVSSATPKALTGVGASNIEGDSDSSSMGPIIGGAVGAVAVVAALVGVGVYVKKKSKKPPASAGGGQAQGGVTLSAPAQSTDEKI